jgi:prevent-host-death family protein
MTSKKTESRSSRSSTNRRPQVGSKKRQRGPRRVAIAEMKDDFSRYLRIAAREDLVITRHGRPAGVLIGFESEDDWLVYRLQNDPTFLARIADARDALQRGEGTRLEDVD